MMLNKIRKANYNEIKQESKNLKIYAHGLQHMHYCKQIKKN